MIEAWFGLQSLALLAQAAPAPAPAGKGGGGALEQFFGSGMGQLLPFLLIGIVFYFLMMRPEQKKRKDQEKLLSALKKNDLVVTIGGIRGTIVNAAPGSTYVTIKVDTNTKLKILRTAISRVGSPDEIADEDNESK